MCGFYGLDLYNLSGSMQAVIEFLDREDPELAKLAHRRYGCLEPWAEEPQLYGRNALIEGFARCEVGAIQMLTDLLKRQLDCFSPECDEWLDAAANARLVKDAEAYYRVMYHGSAESWNLRDTHMFDTLNMILDAKGPNSKAIVWAHNSHIGNAAFTDMGMRRDELNIGYLVKERYDARARLIGFGTHTGTVAAADDWDEPMKIKQVRPSLPESHERASHDSGTARFLLDLREGEIGRDLREALAEPRLERFIGVIYRPETERWSHYSEAILPRQFDAWVWFDETTCRHSAAGRAAARRARPRGRDLSVRILVERLFEPVMGVELVVERRHLAVARRAVQPLRLAERLMRLELHRAIAKRPRLGFQPHKQLAPEAQPASLRRDPHPLEVGGIAERGQPAAADQLVAKAQDQEAAARRVELSERVKHALRRVEAFLEPLPQLAII